jgi:hypothetical protein
MNQSKTVDSFNELILHNLWKDNSFDKRELFTADGLSLKIIFPGWYNGSWGPDFKEARLMIGQDELYGDIEIHMDEVAWFQHNHHLDENYNRVILHVFINPSSSQIYNANREKIHSFLLQTDDLQRFRENPQTAKNTAVKNLPGVCGLMVNDGNLKNIRQVIYQAAEDRMIQKVELFSDRLKSTKNSPEQEQIFYTSLFKSLGYSNFHNKFSTLSELITYVELQDYFRRYQKDCRTDILSIWLGMLGLLDKPLDKYDNEDLRREWKLIKQRWEEKRSKLPLMTAKSRFPSLPNNNPIRRLYGFYYHLEKIRFQGLLKSWLHFLSEMASILEAETKPLKKIFKNLNDFFPQPEVVPLDTKDSKTKKYLSSKLIGKQRQLIILVNTIIPFFIAWARYNNDRVLEKVLFRFYLLLPPEGSNRKTRFMENRLIPAEHRGEMVKNMAYHQGLIQIHDDCCKSFYEGCVNCSLLSRLPAEVKP